MDGGNLFTTAVIALLCIISCTWINTSTTADILVRNDPDKYRRRLTRNTYLALGVEILFLAWGKDYFAGGLTVNQTVIGALVCLAYIAIGTWMQFRLKARIDRLEAAAASKPAPTI